MRPVNLIPPEDRRGDHAPLRAGVASYAIVAVLAVALIGLVLVILTNNKISDSQTEIAGLEARKAQADLAAANLAPYDQFASTQQARSQTVNSLAKSRFDWERVLNELALVIPERVTLETLTGTSSAGTSVAADSSGSAASTDASVLGPSLLISGCADGQKGVARLLAALRDIDGVTRVGMQSSELGDQATTAGETAAGSTTAEGGSCQVKPSIAKFQITVAFDAVPVPPAALAPTTTPASTTTETGSTTTTTSTTTAPTTGDEDVAAAQAEQQSAVDSANNQISDAKHEAATVGVGN